MKSYRVYKSFSKSFRFFAVFGLIANSALFVFAQETRPPETARSGLNLEPRQKIEKEIAGGQAHEFFVKAEAGQAVFVDVEQRGVDVAVTAYDLKGEKLGEIDSPNGDNGAEPLFFIAEQAGNYRVEVRPGDKNAKKGFYDIQLKETRPATENDRKEFAAARLFLAADTLRLQSTADSLRQSVVKFKEAENAWRAIGNSAGAGRAIYYSTLSFWAMGDMKSALEASRQSADLWRKAGDKYMEAESLTNVGVLYNALGDRQKALENYERSLVLWRELKKADGEGRALAEIGALYYSSGDIRRALEYFEKALPLKRTGRDFSTIASTLSNIGSAYRFLGEPAKGMDFFQQALEMWRMAGDRAGEAQTLMNLSEANRDIGELGKAFEYSQKAIENYRLLGNRFGEAAALNMQGNFYYIIGNYPLSITQYESALALARSTGNRGAESEALNSMGTSYTELGEYDKATDVLQASLAITKTLNSDSGMATVLHNLGYNYLFKGDLPRALENFQSALALWSKNGLFSAAHAHRQIGLTFSRQKKYTEALEQYEKALAIFEKTRSQKQQAEINYFIALVFRDQNEIEKSLASVEKSLNLIEKTRSSLDNKEFRTSFFAGYKKYYELYISLLMRLHAKAPNADHAARALEISEQSRARVLLELLAQARADIRSGADAKLLLKERELQQRLGAKAEKQTQMLANSKTPPSETSEIEGEINELSSELEQVRTAIRQTSPRYAALTQPAPLKATEIQNLLDKDTVLLEYALGDAESFVWLVSSDKIKSFVLPKRDEIESSARRFYELLTARNQTPANETAAQQAARIEKADRELSAAGQKLKQILTGQFAGELAGVKRLAVVTEGVLQYVPFAALDLPFEIVNLPSASALSVLRKEQTAAKKAAKTLAVVADPVFSETDPRVFAAQSKNQAKKDETIAALDQKSVLQRSFEESTESDLKTIPRLPFSRREAEAIVQKIPANQSLKAVDFAANAETVTGGDLADFRIVHFATHGFLNSKNPELSGLVLSLVNEKGEAQNGFLRLSDIYNLQLNSDLVVLSACQTALGKDVRGEGLIGLTRGFMYAGSRRVVSSLWKVDDAATAELMKRFYAAMLQKNLRPAEALRSAQTEMSRDARYSSPYFWAAFTLQGEWK
jgi:CHAT domain-containing protein